MQDVEKEFKPSSWSIDNKTSIYILTIIITLVGLFSYNKLPKEQFPEVKFPSILVTTIYPGTTPADMEKLVTKQIEKQLKTIVGIKKVKSNSVQDFSVINVEFNTDQNVDLALQRVKDAVDKAKTDLPQNLPSPPQVRDIDVSQIPIMQVHISGDLPLDKMKNYADDLKDEIEGLKEITRADMVGALEREIQIDVDMYKAEVAHISFNDIENAVKFENMTISGGLLDMDGLKRSISIKGEYKDVNKIGDIVVRGSTGAVVYLKDIATIKDDFEEKESYARLEKQSVITLNVIKRSGENLISASDKIIEIAEHFEKDVFPPGLKTTITGDQSEKTRVTLHDLINTIIIGFILVTVILMFFMGTTNAIFVAMSVPLSCAIAFMVFPAIGFKLNFIVLFSFLLALGIVVDDAIVVIENTHRIFANGKVPIKKAAKLAAGEVFLPVFSGTMTTLAPFIPLAFWQGVIGKFMFYLPVTLIVTLLASLLVAYIINPVFAVDFMKTHEEEDKSRNNKRSFKITAIIFAVIAILSYLSKNFGLGNFAIILFGLYVLNRFVLWKWIKNFQENLWPRFQNFYKGIVEWALTGKRPIGLMVGTIVLFFATFVLTAIVKPNVVFFPQSDPNFIYTYITLPNGTSAHYTDSITQIVEDRVFKVVGKDNPLVQSIISNVAVGANDPTQFEYNFSPTPHLGKVTVAFVEFAKRNGKSTRPYLDEIREATKGIPGAEIVVEQERSGPPTGKPIAVEIKGDDIEQLTLVSNNLKHYLDSIAIPGVEELKSDVQNNKPELVIEIDRERANREGVSTAQIGMEIRTAVFGKEVSKLKDANDEYPIMVRYQKNQRSSIEALMNLKITFRDMNMQGMVRQIPLSSVASIKYANTYGGIKRLDDKPIITLSSNVLSGYNANEIVAKITKYLNRYEVPNGVVVKMGGEQEDQKETGAFLGTALMVSLGLIFLILVTQFNSISKPIIILSEVVLSLIGVFLGFSIFNMQISIVMTGVGIIALAGIVVRNGILLVEFTDILMHQGVPYRQAIIEAARTRMTPVLLTATATMLGLVPLAVGLNIDFASLLSTGNPHIFFGGDSVAFWGPLSWTMIFGLGFATFLTLVLVPVMLYLNEKLKLKLKIKSVKS
ncbi:MAG: efflux RND transporter permease subunit [Bacteroidia bacterium]|nr:efflux RND transporter permease subunit [Bacteroidia bacterium]MCZ2141726.1 efflux RND transporter permease subunit [Bacteroidia bacterium]